MPKLRLSVKSTNDTNGNRNTNATFDDFLCGRSNLIVFHGGWSTCITMIHFIIDAESKRPVELQLGRMPQLQRNPIVVVFLCIKL